MEQAEVIKSAMEPLQQQVTQYEDQLCVLESEIEDKREQAMQLMLQAKGEGLKSRGDVFTSSEPNCFRSQGGLIQRLQDELKSQKDDMEAQTTVGASVCVFVCVSVCLSGCLVTHLSTLSLTVHTHILYTQTRTKLTAVSSSHRSLLSILLYTASFCLLCVALHSAALLSAALLRFDLFCSARSAPF
jgi:hypothetical protein